jgi:glycosyltransferase involved in cell wall biosynthesis
MRIALVAPASTGGIAKHVAMLAQGMRDRGHAVSVAAPAATLRLLGSQPTRAVPLRVGGPSVHALHQLRTLAAQHDVVHAHGVRASVQCALAGVHPLVTTWHNAPLGGRGRRWAHAALERLSVRGSDAVLGASIDLVDRARAAGAARAQLVPVVSPLVTGAIARSPSMEPLVLAVARLHPQKRLDLLIEATRGWSAEATRRRVVVVGDGPQRAVLERRARRAGSPIEFVGATEDVASWLSRASVVVVCSDWEARPLVAQEALQAGVPLVATAVGGIPDLVGDAALLIPPGDAVALREAIVTAVTDPTIADRLRSAGPVRASGWPTAAQMLDQLEAIYRDISRGDTPRPD